MSAIEIVRRKCKALRKAYAGFLSAIEIPRAKAREFYYNFSHLNSKNTTAPKNNTGPHPARKGLM